MLLAAVMAITATILALPAAQLGNRALQHRVTAAPPPLFIPSTPARACVTRRGLCPIGLVRAGDPCSCPDPLHGSVSGHVARVGGPSARATHTRDWPGEEAEGPVLGP